MCLSLTKMSKLVGLTVALLIAFSSARPTVRPSQIPIRILIAQITGNRLHVHEDGNVTAIEQDGHILARFHYNQNGDHIFFQNVDYNRSFLHFEEIFSSTNDSLDFSGYNETQFNATEFNSTESYSSGESAGNGTNAVPFFKLVLGELKENGIVRHHMWVEESVGGSMYTYSIRPNNETVCYLAFEQDGSPVSEPCDKALASDPKARFFLVRGF